MSSDGSVTRWLHQLQVGDLGLLGDRALESVAVWRMEGYSVEEIADRLGYAPRSIKRKLALIRAAWEKEVAP
jgi:hypothetical protein